MLAPLFSSCHAASRWRHGVRSHQNVFNILGPLTNPARVKGQVLGVADPGWCS